MKVHFTIDKEVLCKGFRHMKDRMYRRRFWAAAAVLLFMAEMAMAFWGSEWMRGKQVSQMSANIWILESSGESAQYCIEFKPQYRNLKYLGIVLLGKEEMLGEGLAEVTITDKDGQQLFEGEISYEKLVTGVYFDMEVPAVFQRGKSYYLTLNLHADEFGVVPYVPVCTWDTALKENIGLTFNGEQQDAQPLIRYAYEDVVIWSEAVGGILLFLVTALIFAVGLPDNPVVRRAVKYILLVMAPLILGSRLEMLSARPSMLLPHAMKWNFILMYLLELIVWLCTQSACFSIVLVNIFLTILYSANYFMIQYRGVPLRPNDLAAAGTAVQVVGNYNLQFSKDMAVCWGICILFVVLAVQTWVKPKKRALKWRAAGHLAALAMGVFLAIGSKYILVDTDFWQSRNFKEIHGWEQHHNFWYNGYLVGSLVDIKIQSVMTEMPEGYSIEKVESLLEGRTEDTQTDGVKPHIILILVESFSDLRVLGDLQISEENMPFFSSLKENTIRGYVNASVLGGGTANSEFEVLTGCTTGLLPIGYVPYQQCITRDKSSLVSNVQKAGYTFYTIHPERSANWNRERVYAHFGVNHSVWKDAFEDAQKIHYGPSDLDTYKKVVELYENREGDEKLFLFDLTVQNHGGYDTPDIDITVTAQNAIAEQADLYLSLIQESDKALGWLIDYFDRQEEPVLICMFGDHQPSMPSEFYESLFEQTPGLEEVDKVLNKYKTPFAIWANYDIPEQDGLDIGMSYLGPLLMDVAGLPMSPYFAFLREYMEEYPVVTVNGYKDKDGNFYSWTGDSKEVWEYRVLQYNYLFDKKTMSWGF